MSTIRPNPKISANARLKTVKKLLDEGVPVNARTYSGRTLLHGAVLSREKDTIEYLIKRGANVNARGPGGLTPLMEAVTRGYKDGVRLLIKAGANLNAHRVAGFNQRKVSPLLYAINYHNMPIVRMLIHAGAKVNRNVLNRIHNQNMLNALVKTKGERSVLKSVVRRATTARRVSHTASRAPKNVLARSVFRPNRVQTMMKKYGNNWLDHV